MKRAPVDDTASRVRTARAAAGLSQAAFAVLVGVSRPTVQRWEAGMNSVPPYVLGLIEHRAAHAAPEELDELRRAARR